MSSIKVIKASELKPKYTDSSKLPFGRLFTDHMLTMKYTPEKKWHDLIIEPYADFSMDPASMVLHYGQAIFEGMKAYLDDKSQTRLFRPRENFKRMNVSAARMKIPMIDEEQVLEGLYKLLNIEKEWIPKGEGTSLYIRPTIIATDPYLGVRPSETYLFFIILSPVGPYYAEGFNPINIYVEDEYVRAVRGGTGTAKAAGNYAASLLASANAKLNGFSQVLWLDGIERKYCEEVGAMNIFFEFDNEIVTPELSGSILPGITRKSIIQLARDMGKNVVERPIAIDEVFERNEKGELKEVFGTG
ncbi:MAG: branched-chain amino acid aminotransferase, partial [Clostridiales bacterium]|nr:branched-chain amino acid aminotransferase [Clostridiales bacterium]